MLSYLSKFVLQMLPTISATVIGAYIVATWINPKTPPEPARVAASAAEPAKPAAAEAEAKAAEPVTSATSVDTVRVIPIDKPQVVVTEAAALAAPTAPEPAAADYRTANDLARAAIQKLRGSPETARSAEESARPAAQPKTQQARAAKDVFAPPLPPPVSITSLRYPQEGDDQANIADADRFAPPADIPAERAPVSLQASHRVAESPSFADDFLTATRTFFRALTPPQR